MTWLPWWHAQYSVGERLHSRVQVRTCYLVAFSCFELYIYMLYIAFQNKAIIFGIKQSYSEPASKSVSNNLTVNQLQNQQCTSFRITITESNDMNNDVKTNAKSTCQNHISKSTRVRAETQKRVDLSNVDTFLCYVRIHFVDFCCAMFHVLCVFFDHCCAREAQGSGT